MNVITPRLPAGTRELFNALYQTSDPQCLTDDLYAAQLPGGVSITVGWFPEMDPTGAYEICFFRGDYENQLIEPITTCDLGEVVRAIEERSLAYIPTPMFVAATGSVKTNLSSREQSEQAAASWRMLPSLPLSCN